MTGGHPFDTPLVVVEGGKPTMELQRPHSCRWRNSSGLTMVNRLPPPIV